MSDSAVDAGQKETPATRPAEPDEKNRRSGEGVSTSNTSTPGGIWKSLFSATGGFGCERQVYYRETIRDVNGYRLDFGASERLIFGIAIDRAHTTLMKQRWTGEALSESKATETALSVARGVHTETRWTDDEWAMLEARVHLACEKLTGAWPNLVENGASKDGDSTPPITWLDVDGLSIEAQVRLEAPALVHLNRSVVGKPDYVYRDESGLLVAWVDVKALSKSGSYPAKWMAGEAVVYDYMLTHANGGERPRWHGYLEYRRVAKPYWALIVDEVGESVVELARGYFARWDAALAGHNPDLLSFQPRACAKCDWREPIPPLDYAGCPIGDAVSRMRIAVEEDE